ncbi:MAG: [Fe-S]-binding protein [Thermoproteota archaeon]|nr:MAG: [Fe-S]-binding protein [Candidatus Korarchaeota archaeon]
MPSRRLAVVDVDRCVGCQLCMFACSRRHGVGGLENSAILVRSVGGVERGFTVVVCRACLDPQCARVCPEEALKPREGGGVVLEPSLCTGCGLCREACVIGAVMWDDEANKPVICIHCGYCAQYCPHGVISIEVRESAS